MTTLSPLLPQTGAEHLDLHVSVARDAAPGALLGLPDWLLALARRRTCLRAFSCTLGGVRTGESVLSLEPATSGPLARLEVRGPGRFRLAWTDAEAAVQLCRTLAQAVDLPPDVEAVEWTAHGPIARREGGHPLPVPTAAPPSAARGAADPLEALPGQGILGPVAFDAEPKLDWLCAYTAYAVRAGLSLDEAPPWPLLRPGGPAPVVLGEGDALVALPDGRILLPGGAPGADLLQALARIGTYPERPLRLHREAPPAQREGVLYERSWRIPWEGDRLLQALAALREDLRSAASAEIYASEGRSVREEIAARAGRLLAGLGHAGVALQVRSAYKQAYHYAVEELRGELASLRAHALDVRVPRAPRGEEVLGDECSFVSTLAPADEVLQEDVPLPGGVRVELWDGEDVRFVARDRDGEICCEHFLKLFTARIPRDVPYPGRVAVAETGGVRLRDGAGRTLREVAVPTDLEAVCLALDEGLGELRDRLAGARSLPLFGELQVDARVSEPDEDLPAAWERFSPAEELHEEIYFGALAALEPVCQGIRGDVRGPGAVLPRVTLAERQPSELRLRATAPGEALGPAAPRPLALRAIVLRQGELELVPRDVSPGYAVPPGQLPKGVRLQGAARPPAPAAPTAPLRGPYPAEAAWPLAEASAHRQGALAWVEGYSYQGRPLPAWAYHPYLAEGTVSLRRLGASRPTLIVVAGHHANEASSTVSVLRLPDAVRRLGLDVLVAALTMENPDGAALHRRLLADHPRWKLHAARFNAVGHEFGRDGPDSSFGEALARARLAGDLRADVLIDDHGVPGHEWAQPLSGRGAPPYFPVAYTYPSGMFYGIGEGQAASPGERVAHFWRRVAERLSEDGDLSAAQERLWARYERYGGHLCPARYPSRLNRGWPFQESGRATRQAPPAWPIALTTEVADEGAAPEQFELSVRAHLIADLAIVEVLGETEGKLRP